MDGVDGVDGEWRLKYKKGRKKKRKRNEVESRRKGKESFILQLKDRKLKSFMEIFR